MVKPSPNRRFFDLEQGGDVASTDAFDLVEDVDDAFLRSDLHETSPHALECDATFRLALGIDRSFAFDRHIESSEHSTSAAPGAKMHEDRSRGDPEEPRRRFRVAAKTREPTMRSNEDLLREIFDVGVARGWTEQAVNDAQDVAGVRAIEALERR